MGDNTTPHHTSKNKKQESKVSSNKEQTCKFYNHFLFKASLLVFFLVVLPLFTSQAPEFINQTLQTRSWEIIQLIFVGIAVSYGLFSRKSDEAEKEHSSKIDNAQSYVSGLLQVSSVFDDESEPHDEKVVQTWSSQYHRNEPVVVVARENLGLSERRAVSSRISEKPLLLPVRSLRSRVKDDKLEDQDTKHGSLTKPDTVPVSNPSSSNSNNIPMHSHITNPSSSNGNKYRNGDFGGSSPRKDVRNIEENVVRPSPIPWRSRSMKMEMKGNEEKTEKSKIEPFSLRSQSFTSPRPNNSNSPSRKLSPSLSFSSESQPKIIEDVVRKKSFRKSAPAPPPPPPPPPPPHFFYKNPHLTKSNSSVTGEKVREFRPFIGSSRGKEHAEEFIDQESDKTYEMIQESYNFGSKQTFEEFPHVEKNEKFYKVTSLDHEDSGTESEDDYFEDSSGNTSKDTYSEEANESFNDGGPDVDKKADEFIAKFREQIRLQRIESIRKSTRNFVR